MEIYLVTGILLIIWLSIFFYVRSLDKKLKMLEKAEGEKK
ncbi:MAG: CcmD family protein [Bacteroidetes bacterium]|nr:CcmD family protein [Bacteroidota bacterium]